MNGKNIRRVQSFACLGTVDMVSYSRYFYQSNVSNFVWMYETIWKKIKIIKFWKYIYQYSLLKGMFTIGYISEPIKILALLKIMSSFKTNDMKTGLKMRHIL